MENISEYWTKRKFVLTHQYEALSDPPRKTFRTRAKKPENCGKRKSLKV